MEFRQAGLTGVVCFPGGTTGDATAEAVAALTRALNDAGIRGVLETVPGFDSVFVRYDPLRVSEHGLCRKIKKVYERIGEIRTTCGKTVEIPVCYGGRYGPDLAFVAENAGLTPEEVIRIHCAPDYRIRMIGFLPAFPYLGGLDERIYTPRLETPRAEIPAGSVGIGGMQTGIYPLASPGGWRLIGRTPMRLFDPEKGALYAAGDRIRFVPVGPEVFEGRDP